MSTKRKEFFDAILEVLPVGSKKARLCVKTEILSEMSTTCPIDLSLIVSFPGLISRLVCYVHDPDALIGFIGSSSSFISEVFSDVDFFESQLEVEFNINRDDSLSFFDMSHDSPCLLMDRDDSMMDLWELSSTIPQRLVMNYDPSHDHPFAKLMALRGHNVFKGCQKAKVNKNKNRNDPYKWSRTKTNLENATVSSLNNYMSTNFMVFFEFYGYRVLDGDIVEASDDHLLKFFKYIKKIPSLDRLIIRRSIDDLTCYKQSKGKDVTIPSCFSLMLDYVVNQLHKREWIVRKTNISFLNSLHVTQRCSSSIYKNIISQLFPDDLRVRINRVATTILLIKKIRRKEFTLQELISLCDLDARLEPNSIRGFRFNGQHLVIQAMNSDNRDIVEYICKKLGRECLPKKTNDKMVKLIAKYVRNNY